MTVVNLEQGMPTVAAARIRLNQGLRSAKAKRAGAVKIIHGYGSSGKGGAIKQEVQSFLAAKKRAGYIKDFVPGDRFTPFDPTARAMVDACPAIARDSDYTRGNPGVTIVVF